MEYSKERNYWIKLNREFFMSEDILMLESLPNGKEYCLFYVKLLAVSAEHGGRLVFNDVIPYNEDMLAAITNTNVDTVRSAMAVLSKMGLLETMSDDTLYVTAVQEITGSQTKGAARKAMSRANNKKLEKGDICPPDVPLLSPVREEGTERKKEPKKEREVRREEERCSYGTPKEEDRIPYSEIVEYLNEKTGAHYRPSTRDTRSHIRARYAEGFRLEDFKTVIDNMSSRWKGDQRMEQYLRPQTLFNSKFESYLNAGTKSVRDANGNEVDFSVYDF